MARRVIGIWTEGAWTELRAYWQQKAAVFFSCLPIRTTARVRGASGCQGRLLCVFAVRTVALHLNPLATLAASILRPGWQRVKPENRSLLPAHEPVRCDMRSPPPDECKRPATKTSLPGPTAIPTGKNLYSARACRVQATGPRDCPSADNGTSYSTSSPRSVLSAILAFIGQLYDYYWASRTSRFLWCATVSLHTTQLLVCYMFHHNRPRVNPCHMFIRGEDWKIWRARNSPSPRSLGITVVGPSSYRYGSRLGGSAVSWHGQ